MDHASGWQAAVMGSHSTCSEGPIRPQCPACGPAWPCACPDLWKLPAACALQPAMPRQPPKLRIRVRISGSLQATGCHRLPGTITHSLVQVCTSIPQSRRRADVKHSHPLLPPPCGGQLWGRPIQLRVSHPPRTDHKNSEHCTATTCCTMSLILSVLCARPAVWPQRGGPLLRFVRSGGV